MSERYPFEPKWELTPVEKMAVALTLALARHAPECMRRAEFTDEELIAVAGELVQRCQPQEHSK